VSEEAFEEYAGAAATAKADTLATLRRLHAEAVEAARIRAENERSEQVIAALQVIAGVVTACIGKPSAFIQERIDSLAVSVHVDDEVNAARANALVQLVALLDAAKLTEDIAAAARQVPVSAPAPALEPAPVIAYRDENTGRGVLVDMPPSEEEQNAAQTIGGADVTVRVDDGRVEGLARLAGPIHSIPAVPTSRPIDTAKQRLDAAAALAKRFNATEMGGVWMFDSIGDIADMLDEVRGA
jgi:hypothetical protein